MTGDWNSKRVNLILYTVDYQRKDNGVTFPASLPHNRPHALCCIKSFAICSHCEDLSFLPSSSSSVLADVKKLWFWAHPPHPFVALCTSFTHVLNPLKLVPFAFQQPFLCGFHWLARLFLPVVKACLLPPPPAAMNHGHALPSAFS